jgi:hypothetical protein
LQRAAKNAVISSGEYARLAQEQKKEPRFPPEIAADAVLSLSSCAQDRGRTIAESAEKSSDSSNGAAKSAAIDPELANLFAIWDKLPPMIRSAILAVARQHSPEQ